MVPLMTFFTCLYFELLNGTIQLTMAVLFDSLTSKKRSSEGQDDPTLTVLGYKYTIPSFSVITVELKHAIVQGLDDKSGENMLADVFTQSTPYLGCTMDVRSLG